MTLVSVSSAVPASRPAVCPQTCFGQVVTVGQAIDVGLWGASVAVMPWLQGICLDLLPDSWQKSADLQQVGVVLSRLCCAAVLRCAQPWSFTGVLYADGNGSGGHLATSQLTRPAATRVTCPGRVFHPAAGAWAAAVGSSAAAGA